MDKYTILLSYLDKQILLIVRLFDEVKLLNLNKYDSKYVFALKTQQLYTAIEDLLKQIAKAFENHIQDLSSYHRELLIRLNTDIPKFRPAVIKKDTLVLLDKLRSFRNFIRHAYDCELDEEELLKIQDRLKADFHLFLEDCALFREFVVKLT